LSAAVGYGCVAEGNVQVGVADAVVVGGVRVLGCGGSAGEAGGFRVGELEGAGECAADGGGAQLGQGGQGGVPADPVPGAGLGLVPAEDVLQDRVHGEVFPF
jgi:hypothetical protein